MNKKIWKDIILVCLFGSISFGTFLSTILITTLKKHIMSAFMISFVLTFQKTIKLFTDTPFAVYADLRGVRKLFMLSPVFAISCAMLLSFNSVYAAIAAIMLHGIDISIKMGKIEARVYNGLKFINSETIFPKVMCIYFVASNVVMGSFSYTAGILQNKYGHKGIFIAVCIQSFLALLCLLFMEDLPIERAEKKGGIRFLFKESFEFIGQFPVAIGISMLLAFYNFFGLQFLPILKLFLLQYGIQPVDVMKFVGISIWTMGLGATFSFFICNKVSLKLSFFIWLAEVLVMLVVLVLGYNIKIIVSTMPAFCAALLGYIFLYPTIQIVAMKSLELLIPSRARYLLTSFNNLLSITINLFGNLLIGYVATKDNGNYSVAILLIIFLLIVVGLATYLSVRKSISSD